MRNREGESGQALVLVALSMAVIMGFLALAIDVGLLFRSRRNLQIAADAAATAAAVNYLYYGSTTQAQAAAVLAAAANGVTITASDVHTPPLNGPYTGTTAGSYFEVIPQQLVGTNFMGVITHTGTTNVAARAVAGTPTAGTACIYITSTNGSDVWDMQGNAQVTAPGCGIYVNSNNANALSITGGSANVTATYFRFHGSKPSGNKTTSPTAPTFNAPAQSDPLGTLLGPNPATDCASGNTVTVAAVTAITPLPSSNGITCFSHANVTLAAGMTLPGGVIYAFENGVSMLGNLTVGSTSSGATLDIMAGLYSQGNNDITIHAPTTGGLTGTGPYNGVAIMEPPLMSSPNPPGNSTAMDVQFGSSTAIFDGMIYAPSAQVTLHDHGGGGLTATSIVAASMFFQPSSTHITSITSYNSQHPTTTPLRTVTLVE